MTVRASTMPPPRPVFVAASWRKSQCPPSATAVWTARMDPEDRRHAVAVERGGVVRAMRTGGSKGSGVERFQLHTEAEDGELQPVHRAWRQFEFIPKQQAGAVLGRRWGRPISCTPPSPPTAARRGAWCSCSGRTTPPSPRSKSPRTERRWFRRRGRLPRRVAHRRRREGGQHQRRAQRRRARGGNREPHMRDVRGKRRLRARMAGERRPAPAHVAQDDPGRRSLAPLTSIAAWSAPANRTRQLLAAGSADGVVYTWTADASGNSTDFGWRAASVLHQMAGMEVSHLSFRGDGASLLAGSGSPTTRGAGKRACSKPSTGLRSRARHTQAASWDANTARLL